MGFEWDEATADVDENTGDPLVGRRFKKEFGEDGWFCGIVVGVQSAPLMNDDEDVDLYKIEYDDGDEEELSKAEVESLLVGSPAIAFRPVKHLYGDIIDAKVMKSKSGKNTVTRSMLYVRWDQRVYDDDDEGALEWVEVLPKNYGKDGKDGWEVVEARNTAADDEEEDEEWADGLLADGSDGSAADDGDDSSSSGSSEDEDEDEDLKNGSGDDSDPSLGGGGKKRGRGAR